MIILDTNVLSALMRQDPDAKVVFWLDRQARASIWTTAVSVLEIRFGLSILASSKRRSLLIQGFQALLDKIDGRILPFDESAAQRAAELMAVRQKRGQPGDLRDTLIAGIVLAQNAAFATRNVRHFGDLPTVVNPWEA